MERRARLATEWAGRQRTRAVRCTLDGDIFKVHYLLDGDVSGGVWSAVHRKLVVVPVFTGDGDCELAHVVDCAPRDIAPPHSRWRPSCQK